MPVARPNPSDEGRLSFGAKLRPAWDANQLSLKKGVGIGTGAAYRNHNYYGSRKYPSLRRPKALALHRRAHLSVFLFVFR